jgi:hypothetical protein
MIYLIGKNSDGSCVECNEDNPPCSSILPCDDCDPAIPAILNVSFNEAVNCAGAELDRLGDCAWYAYGDCDISLSFDGTLWHISAGNPYPQTFDQVTPGGACDPYGEYVVAELYWSAVIS